MTNPDICIENKSVIHTLRQRLVQTKCISILQQVGQEIAPPAHTMELWDRIAAPRSAIMAVINDKVCFVGRGHHPHT